MGNISGSVPLDTGGERIARFTALLTGSGVICKLLLLVFTAFAAHKLGRASYGRLEYLVEMALIFSVLVDFGLEQTLTRDLAKWKDRFHRVAQATLGYRLLVSLPAAAGLMAALSLIDFCTRDRVHVFENSLAAAYCVLIFHVALAKALLRSQEELTAEAGINLADRTFLVLVGIIVLAVGGRVTDLLTVYMLSACLALALAWKVITRRIARCTPRWDLRLALRWQKAAVPIGMSAACILLLHREDTAMVNVLVGDAETGIYKAAYRPFEGLFLFPQMLAVASYPILASLHSRGEKIGRLIAQYLRVLLLVSLPMAVGGTLIAHSFIAQIYPEYYPASVPVLIILVWSLPCIFGNFLLGTVLNAVDRQTKNFLGAACAMASNFILNIPAILLYGAYGAAAVTIISQTVYLIMNLYYCSDLIEWHAADLYRCLGMVLSITAMGMALAILPLAWYWETLIGITLYAPGLVVFRGLVREDFDLLASIRRNH